MRVLTANFNIIPIGRQGENLATQILFPVVKSWKELFGNGTFQLLFQRPHETTSYACVIETTEENIVWNITSTEVANVGRGFCELQYFVDEVIAKSALYNIAVAPSLGNEGGDPPEPWESWVEEVLQAAIDAQQSAEQAAQSAQDIEDLTVNAETIPAGQQASVEKTHPEGEPYNLKFYIPEGKQGQVGPQGPQGPQGIQGPQGEQGIQGETGNGISEITLISTSGREKTYRIAFTNGDHYDYVVTDGETGQTGATGNGIVNIQLISTVGLQKTYRINFTNGTYFDYIVTDGETPTIDPVPTEGSNNAVSSGGTYTAIQDAVKNKADKKGVYDDMTVGTAKQLLATVGVVEKVPYNFRTSAGAHDIGSNRETDKIIGGGTVVWNQLAKELNNTNYYYEGGQRTFSNGSSTYTAVSANDDFRLLTRYAVPRVAGHKYLVTFNADIQITPTITQWAFSWQRTDSETADSETHNINYANSSLGNGRFAFVVEATYTANTTAYLFVRKSGNFEAGDTITTSNYQIYDLTKMFGSTIANYIYSLETTTAGDGVAWFRKLFPKAYYSYNAGQLMSVKTTSHDMVGFNAYNHATGTAILLGGNEYQITGAYTALSYVDINGDSETITPDANGKFTPTNNGTLSVTGGNDTDTCVHLVWSGEHDNEHKPYEKHSYALDPNLELRGFPKLATDNSLYYDGDEYEGSGLVTRQYGIETYETYNPNVVTEPSASYSNIAWYLVRKPSDSKTAADNSTGGLICSKYEFGPYVAGANRDDASLAGKIYAGFSNSYFYIGYPVGTTLEEARADLNGMQIVYKLATPTTEFASPFANPQIVDDYGTEQYVDNREVAIPVGHETLYQANLRDKLQHLPSLANSGDGVYHIRQTGTQMTLVLDTTASRLNALEANKKDKLAQSTDLTSTTQTVSLAKNTRYAFGTLTDLSIAFPATADDGDEIVIEFVSGSTATTLTLDNTNAIYNFSSINADKFVELNAQYKVSVGKWVVYSAETDYTVV